MPYKLSQIYNTCKVVKRTQAVKKCNKRIGNDGIYKTFIRDFFFFKSSFGFSYSRRKQSYAFLCNP